ncbi:hypothetical protein RSP03_24820 [Cereibacter sphaeroides]|nr:hypothetical protein RSP03_24820 [Cereibacter sphaeroides]
MTTDRLHTAALMHRTEVARGRMSRREFLTRTTALGVSAGAAYALLGLAQPVRAQETPRKGGTLRMEMETRAEGSAHRRLVADLERHARLARISRGV